VALKTITVDLRINLDQSSDLELTVDYSNFDSLNSLDLTENCWIDNSGAAENTVNCKYYSENNKIEKIKANCRID